MYNQLNEVIEFLVGMGYDYDCVLNWNVSGIFYVLFAISKYTKLKNTFKK